MCVVISDTGSFFLVSGWPPPRPHYHKWALGGCGVCLQGRGVGSRCLGTGSVPSVCRGPQLPCSGPGLHPTRGLNIEVWPVLLSLHFPLGVFSEKTTSLQGFTRDPPHPQLGGSPRLPPALGRRHPVSSAFENPDKGLAAPHLPWEPSQGLRGARAWTCLHYDPPLVYLLCSLGSRGVPGPQDTRVWPWGRCCLRGWG